jgi:hypothetical protein
LSNPLVRQAHAELPPVSEGYPPPMGRLPTCSSPVRHVIPRKAPVRLACIRHAASVDPEPGSNSPPIAIYCYFDGLHQHHPTAKRPDASSSTHHVPRDSPTSTLRVFAPSSAHTRPQPRLCPLVNVPTPEPQPRRNNALVPEGSRTIPSLPTTVKEIRRGIS